LTLASFIEQLQKLGYQAGQEGDRGSFPFGIETGKRAGENIKLGFAMNGDFV
jgi:hypothetical protein